MLISGRPRGCNETFMSDIEDDRRSNTNTVDNIESICRECVVVKGEEREERQILFTSIMSEARLLLLLLQAVKRRERHRPI